MNKQVFRNTKAIDELFDGTGSVEDTQLFGMIEKLKRASLDCSELCVTVEYEEASETREKLNEINLTIAETWHILSGLLSREADRPGMAKTA